MVRLRAPILLATILTGAMLGGCSQPSPTTTSSNTAAMHPAPAAHPNIFRFKIGELDAVAVKDGDINIPNDGKTFALGQPVDAVSALLAAAGQQTDTLHLSIQPLLVRSGTRVLLFDTGAAGVSFARAGHLQASLREAGVEPSQVTDIFISHRHPDHVGGLVTPETDIFISHRHPDHVGRLVTREGALAFPNATIHLSAPEWGALKGDSADNSTALVNAIAPKVATFQPGTVILPGVVTSVEVKGHTPGHSAYEITSGKERLLYIGDTAHHFVVSVQRPEWTVQYDANAPVAQPSRRALLQRAADGNLRLYAVHFPFPGLGHVSVQGDSFVWVPEGP